MIYQHLFDRVKVPATVRAGLIGAGQFGTPIVTQAPLIPRLEVPVVADIDTEAGRRAYRKAGFAQEDIVVCASRAGALRVLKEGNRLTKDVPAGPAIALDVIAPPADSALWSLRRQQDAHFLG